MSKRHRGRAVILSMGLLAATAIPANAIYACAVQKSPDGFVALRSTPSATGQVIAKAKPGDAVVVEQKENGDQIASGPWLRVLHYKGEIAPPMNDPARKTGKQGWMHRRYVGDCG